MKRYFLLLFGIFIIGMQGCNSPAPTALDAAEFAAKAKEQGYEVLDVRTPEEYAEGHWPSARLLDYDGGEFLAKISELDSEKTYLIYCRTIRRSTAAAQALREKGIDAYILEEGYFPLEPYSINI
jgi:rhodanese-related sulfurtransferase